MIFGGNHGEFVRAVAILLKVACGYFAEHARKASCDVSFFLMVAGTQQNIAHVGGGSRRHFFGAND